MPIFYLFFLNENGTIATNACPFRDASMNSCSSPLTITRLLRWLEKCIILICEYDCICLSEKKWEYPANKHELDKGVQICYTVKQYFQLVSNYMFNQNSYLWYVAFSLFCASPMAALCCMEYIFLGWGHEIYINYFARLFSSTTKYLHCIVN